MSFMGSFDDSVGFIPQFPDILPSLTALFQCVTWKHGYKGLKLFLEAQDPIPKLPRHKTLWYQAKEYPAIVNDPDLCGSPTFRQKKKKKSVVEQEIEIGSAKAHLNSEPSSPHQTGALVVKENSITLVLGFILETPLSRKHTR